MLLNRPVPGQGEYFSGLRRLRHLHRLLWGPATPVGVRLSLAIAISAALHTAIILALHPSRGGTRPVGIAFTARLVPALVAENGRSDQALLLDPGASVSPGADVPQAQQARADETLRDSLPPASPAQPDASAAPAAAQAEVAAGLLPGMRYYLPTELQRPPAAQQPVEPESPAESGWREGSVVLRLFINELGTVDEVMVVRAEPSGVFEKSAIAAFGSARFSPGMLAGAAVKSQLLVEVLYRLERRETSGRGY